MPPDEADAAGEFRFLPGIPDQLADRIVEQGAVELGAARCRAPWEALIEVSGRDARGFLQALLTQDLRRLAPGLCLPAALADRKGHFLADLWVMETAGSFILRARRDRLERLIGVLDRHRITEDVHWRVPPAAESVLLLGPGAASALVDLGLDYEEGRREGGDLGPIGLSGTWMRIRETSPNEFLFVVTGTSGKTGARRADEVLEADRDQMVPGQSGEAGAKRADEVVKVDRARMVHGQPGDALARRLEVLDSPPLAVGWSAFNLGRIRAGTAWFGLDGGEERLVPEILSEDRISFDKGCYLGQETIARLRSRGQANWRLARLKIAGSRPPDPGTDLLSAGGDRVGWITSCEQAPGGDCPALGYLHRRAREALQPVLLPDGNLVATIDAPAVTAVRRS